MNGWKRLGIVLTAPVVLLAGAIGYSEASRLYVTDLRPSKEAQKLTGMAINYAIWYENKGSNNLSHCVSGATYVTPGYYRETYSISCDTTITWRLLNAAFWAGLVAGIFALIGSVIGWVYRGFRPEM